MWHNRQNLHVKNKIVLIGASTGGPGIIERIVRSLDTLHSVSVVIAQHMVADFIPSFAKRLQEHSVNKVCLVNEGAMFMPENIYICQGITSLKQEQDSITFGVKPSLHNEYSPDINSLFGSFAPLLENYDILAIILTGIGDDGIAAGIELELKGASIVTQDEQSSIVDGMPSRARKEIPNISILDNDSIIKKIRDFCDEC